MTRDEAIDRAARVLIDILREMRTSSEVVSIRT